MRVFSEKKREKWKKNLRWFFFNQDQINTKKRLKTERFSKLTLKLTPNRIQLLQSTPETDERTVFFSQSKSDPTFLLQSIPDQEQKVKKNRMCKSQSENKGRKDAIHLVLAFFAVGAEGGDSSVSRLCSSRSLRCSFPSTDIPVYIELL